MCVCMCVNDCVSSRMSATPPGESWAGRSHAGSSTCAMGTWDIFTYVVCVLGAVYIYAWITLLCGHLSFPLPPSPSMGD